MSPDAALSLANGEYQRQDLAGVLDEDNLRIFIECMGTVLEPAQQ